MLQNTIYLIQNDTDSAIRGFQQVSKPGALSFCIKGHKVCWSMVVVWVLEQEEMKRPLYIQTPAVKPLQPLIQTPDVMSAFRHQIQVLSVVLCYIEVSMNDVKMIHKWTQKRKSDKSGHQRTGDKFYWCFQFQSEIVDASCWSCESQK